MELRKIAVICNYKLLPDRIGGMDYFFWFFDEECKKNNIHIDWIFPNASHHGNYRNLTIHAANTLSVEDYFLKFISKNKYSHIITHFVELCTSFFKKVKLTNDAIIIAVDHNPRPLHGYTFKKIIIKRIKGIVYAKYTDQFIGVSNYTVNAIIKDFGKHLKSKSRTIYNGVIIDDILQRKERQVLNPAFLVVSHLRESKGIQDLIEAVKLLPDTIKNKIKIDIYGDGPFLNFLQHKIKDYKLEPNFAFKGSQPNMTTIYYEYDYLLQPTHMECFSLSILESLAANVPVITTSVGGNKEVITDSQNGFIFEPKNVQQLKNILEALANGDKKINLNTRRLIESNFSLDQMIAQYLTLLK